MHIQLHTPLHVATYCEHEQVVKVLLDHDADPNTISEVLCVGIRVCNYFIICMVCRTMDIHH